MPTYQYYKDLLFVLLAKELKVRYKNTFLGYAWSLLHPLAFALVFFVLFKLVMRIEVRDYTLFLICGLFPWQWFQNSVNASTFFFLGNSSLIKRVKFPKELLVMTGVMNDLLHFILSIPVIVAFMLYYHKTPSIFWLWQIPLLLIVQFLFTYAIALLVSTLNLFFRDLERLTMILTMLWFYLTPVLFPVEMIPEGFKWVIYLNPMGALIVAWRTVFLDGALPLEFLMAPVVPTILIYLLGHRVYKSLEWRFAELV
jgi:lipopolysaccharide transport system permease protein